MSKKGDFLSGFSGGNTQKPLTEQPTMPVKESKTTEMPKTGTHKTTSVKPNLAENKKLADKIVAESEKKQGAARTSTATRPTQNASAIIKAPEHVVTTDTKFHKRKMIQYGVIGSVSIVAIIAAIFLVRMLNRVAVIDFTEDPLSEVQTWGVMNGITIETNRAYSVEVPEDHVISQSQEPGSNLARRSALSVVVSDGPDMDEVVGLPDFEEMTRAQITTWRTQNGFTTSSIVFNDEASTEVDANDVIRVEVPNDVDVNHFTRSDRLTIVISTGPATVQMPNFMGAQNNTREAVETWAAANPAINVEIVDEPSETVNRDTVLGQSQAPQRDVKEGDTVTIRISAGSPVIVPNFAEISMTEANEWGAEEDLTVRVRQRFNTTVPFGRFVAQSVEPGEELFGADAVVTVTYSHGRPWIGQLAMENDIQETVYEFESKGARITYGINFVDSYEDRGSIVHQSLYNQFIALDAHIVFHVSRGNLTRPEPQLPQAPDLGNGSGSGSGHEPDDDPEPDDVDGG